MNLEYLISNYSYIAIFFSLILVGFLGFFPPSKLIYVLVGFLSYRGDISYIISIIVGAIGHSIGNYIQYEIGRKKGFKIIEKIASFYPLFSINTIKKIRIVFDQKKVFYLFIGKLLDPIKLIISFFAGVAKMNRFLFLIIVFISSLIWALFYSSIGYFFGLSYEDFGWIGFLILLFAIIFILHIYKKLNSKEVEELFNLEIKKERNN